MTKENIFKELNKKLKNLHKSSSLRKPENIDFESEDGTLSVTMSEKGVLANMQNNESAFEGWAIAIKAALPDIANKVVIKWRTPSYSSHKTHYYRFLYRVRCFVMSYEWASYECDKTAKNEYEEVCKEINNWVTNYPSQEASKEAEHEEAQLERKLNEILPGFHNHQLPVGLFNQQVSSKSNYERTPRGGSQIDLWSITENETFTVYELKKNDNRKVGIISELMFYVNVIKDLAEGIIKFGEGAQYVYERSYNEVYKNINEKKITRVIGVFLTNDLHPILNINRKNLFSILNENKRKIEYKLKGFEYDVIKIIDIEL